MAPDDVFTVRTYGARRSERARSTASVTGQDGNVGGGAELGFEFKVVQRELADDLNPGQTYAGVRVSNPFVR